MHAHNTHSQQNNGTGQPAVRCCCYSPPQPPESCASIRHMRCAIQAQQQQRTLFAHSCVRATIVNDVFFIVVEMIGGRVGRLVSVWMNKRSPHWRCHTQSAMCVCVRVCLYGCTNTVWSGCLCYRIRTERTHHTQIPRSQCVCVACSHPPAKPWAHLQSSSSSSSSLPL